MTYGDMEPSAAFDQACAVLNGAVVATKAPEVRKMVTILLAPDGADMSITRSGLAVEFPAARRVFQYLPGLSAPALYAICKGNLDRLPARFLLHADEIKPIRIGAAKADRWIWLVREPDRILLFAREAGASTQPLDPEPLRGWVAADRVFAIFEQPIPCGRCGTAAVRFRALSDALVCPACGRSWPVTVTHDDPGMHFETAH